MPNSELQLRFRVRGAQIDPELLTSILGIVPTESFHVGERLGRAVHEVAGWEWWSKLCGSDTTPLIKMFVELFVAHQEILRSCVDDGAVITLTVVGHLGTGLVTNYAEAERRGYEPDKSTSFEPFLDSDLLALQFDAEAVQFLGFISASLSTHIAADLGGGNGPLWTIRW